MSLRTLTTSVFMAGIFALALTGRLSKAVAGFYLAASIITFAVYALDKSAARNHQWRIPENALHLLALIGGWPGALVAQQKLRHKWRKMSFMVKFWAAFLLNCGMLAWWLR